MIEELNDFNRRDSWWGWSREDTYRYFLAGGGHVGEFDALWSTAIGECQKIAKAIADGRYAASRGSIGYLVAGRKPGSRAV